MRKECSDARESFKKTCIANWKTALCARGAHRRKEIAQKLASRKLRHRRHNWGQRTERGWKDGEDEENSVGREDQGRMKERKDIF